MKPVDNWRRVLRHAWSVRVLALLVLFSGLEVALPFFYGALPITDWQRGGIYFVVSGLAALLRFVAQPSVNPKDQPDADKQASAD